MEESVSGFKVQSNWGDVVEHGERITQALRETGADEEYPDAFEEWDQWRPRAHETIDEDVSEKTAEQAHVKEGEGEQAGKDPDEDIKKAGEKLSESYEKLTEDREKAVGRWSESIDYVTRAADSASRKAIRKVEDTVYKRVMTQLAPYYFDNDLISANIQQTDQGEFTFEVNVNDDELKDAVSEQLHTYDDEIKRWHVTTEKETEQIEAAEGIESLPSTEDSEESKHTVN